MLHRRNLLDAPREAWRPPHLAQGVGAIGSFASSLRRFLDLQAGSIWNDLAALLPDTGGTILDVGCGSQPYRSLMPSSARYVGIDIEDAESQFGYRTPDTIYYTGEVWPVEDASADVVLCTETLEHVRDTDAFLAQARRVLKPGGRILITVPFSARWHFIPHDYWRFTPSGLRAVLERAGIHPIAVYARGNGVTVACYKSMAVFLAVALSQHANPAVRWTLRIVGLPLWGFIGALAALANISLRGRGGDDCLGYTAIAEKKRG